MKRKEEFSLRTYVAPSMRVNEINMEQCFLSSANPDQLQNMDPNELFDEDF